VADVFTVLSQDHQEVKRMLVELEKGPSRATGADEDQLALRKKMTEQLIIEESKHEALEEMHFWPVVRDHLPDGDTLADRATGPPNWAPRSPTARRPRPPARTRTRRPRPARSRRPGRSRPRQTRRATR
jgi:Hemerythrin HHE cation binding domain